MPDKGLGWLPPPDQKHVESYPLRAVLPSLADTIPMPVCIAIPWYSSMDSPQKRPDGTWWLPEPAGGIRGWHEVCLKPPAMRDYTTWHAYYDQGTEGACVGFAMSRMMSLKNRGRYDAFWLYNQSRDRDPWPPGTQGTHARYAGEALIELGHKFPTKPDPTFSQGITEFRWAQNVTEITSVLAEKRQFVVLLNSWGAHGYPHLTRVPLDLLDRLVFGHDGDAVVVVDR